MVSCNIISTTEELCFPEFERLPKMTWLDFISGFGGLCGLCLGISFVSLAEILYWFSIRLWKNIWSVIMTQTTYKQYIDWSILPSYMLYYLTRVLERRYDIIKVHPLNVCYDSDILCSMIQTFSPFNLKILTNHAYFRIFLNEN